MNLEREKRRNRQLRQKVEKVVEDECKKFGGKQVNDYYLFVNGKNTGEIVKMPECLIEQICKAVSENIKHSVSVSHRNMYLALMSE